jgi:hypothetical protein
MKIKAILVTAALGAAMVGSASAQVYSANAVGYVNMTLPAGLSIIANPLNGSPDNSLNSTLVLSDLAIGATIFRFDDAAQGFGDAIQWGGSFLGWLTANADPNWVVVAPGEAFFIQLFGAEDITWVGEVPQGDLSNPIPGDAKLSMRSSQVPQEAPLGSPGVGLEFPGETLDTVYVFDPAIQNYKEPYQYLGGLGWLSANPDDTGLDGPIIPVGQGFFLQKFNVGDTSWDRSFSVNN